MRGSPDRAEALLQRAQALDRHGELRAWEVDVIRCVIALQKHDMNSARALCDQACVTPEGREFFVSTIAAAIGRLPAAARDLLVRANAVKKIRHINRPKAMMFLVVMGMSGLAMAAGYYAYAVLLGGSPRETQAVDDRSPGKNAGTVADEASQVETLDYEALGSLTARVIVRVRVPSPYQLDDEMMAVSTGTAFVVSEDGYLLTNRHVVEVGRELVSKYEDAVDWDVVISTSDGGDMIPAKVHHSSMYLDVAVLKVDRRYDQTLAFARDYKQGDLVVAFGYPAVASEMVSALNPGETRERALRIREEIGAGRIPTAEDLAGKHIGASVFRGSIGSIRDTEAGRIVQTDASAYQGMSGGPLLSMNGKVIGIITAGHSEVEGINVAICWESLAKDLSNVAGLSWPDHEE